MPSPKKQQRGGSSSGRSRRPQQNPTRLKLKVGETWPDGITAETGPAHEGPLRTGVTIAIVVFCCALISALAIHAMVTGNQQRLDSLQKVAWEVLIGFGLWAIAAHQSQKIKAVAQKAMKVVHILKE